MRYQTLLLISFAFFIISCEEEKDVRFFAPVNWDSREAVLNSKDSLTSGVTYLSVYSQIYSGSEHRQYDLTATISMKNVSPTDTIFIKKAEYFNTKGQSIRSYFNNTIYISPLETVEIVIEESDKDGGSGANFIFEWMKKPETIEPLFEAVMISTSSQLGISFTTSGHKID